jgi:RimJ/RimL family protein N-acetyltransferase
MSSLPRASVVLRDRRDDDAGVARIIETDGRVAGSIFSFVADERRYVGYWIERSQHGRGIASTALAQFIGTIDERPLWASVAEDNTASQRVLEGCGFRSVGREVSWSGARGVDVPELLYTLTSWGPYGEIRRNAETAKL